MTMILIIKFVRIIKRIRVVFVVVFVASRDKEKNIKGAYVTVCAS